MSAGIVEAFSGIFGCLPENLICRSFTEEIGRISSVLDSFCSSYYLEWHLKELRRCDLLCSLKYENGSRLNEQLLDSGYATKDKKWETLGRFLTSWNRINAELDDLIPHIWLAFDFNLENNRFDPPNIHFCIDRQFEKRSFMPEHINTLTQNEFDNALRTIIERAEFQVSRDTIALLHKFFSALSPRGEVLHFSFMHSRNPQVLKLNCTIPKDFVTSVLSDSQWNGSLATVEELCHEFAPNEERIKFNICIDEGRCTRFEMELEYNKPLIDDPRRKPMITGMYKRGFINRSILHDLLKWPGNSFTEENAQNEPGKRAYFFERWLDIKICLEEKGDLFTKAYLGFAPVDSHIIW